VQAIVEDLTEQLRLIRIEREPKRGMRVPYHGPFVAAPPSVLKDLERLRDELKAATPSDIEQAAVEYVRAYDCLEHENVGASKRCYAAWEALFVAVRAKQK
jgi:hypothetical protein